MHIELIIKAIRAGVGGGGGLPPIPIKMFLYHHNHVLHKEKKGNFEFIQFVLDHLN